MTRLSILLVLACTLTALALADSSEYPFLIGAGIGDVTGPAAEGSRLLSPITLTNLYPCPCPLQCYLVFVFPTFRCNMTMENLCPGFSN